jgi:hypothetical protein
MIHRRPKVGLRVSLAMLTILACIGDCLNAADPMISHPGWSPVILPTGQYRSEIKSMPIELRPYRPLHFYGNAIRRNYYQSRVVAQANNPAVIANNPASIATTTDVRRSRGLAARPVR